MTQKSMVDSFNELHTAEKRGPLKGSLLGSLAGLCLF